MASNPPGSDTPTCPFCSFQSSDTYALMHHVETAHPENDNSPFIVTEHSSPEADPEKTALKRAVTPDIAEDWDSALSTEDDSADPTRYYVECPTGCGEQIRFAELPVHLDFHFAETAVLDDTGWEGLEAEHVDKKWEDYMKEAEYQVSRMVARDLDTSDGKHSRKDSLKASPRKLKSSRHKDKGLKHRDKSSKLTKKSTRAGSSRRFSKVDLGPYANEKEMPRWLRKELEEEPKITRMNKLQPDGSMVKVETIANQTPGLIPVLAQLSGQDPEIDHTFLCHHKLRHVFKLREEGGFCGYRNIQTLISYIQEAGASGHDEFSGRMPTILALQDKIERAWDRGFNAASRHEIGRIKNTRKYIGTSEAQALFLSLNISCTPDGFVDTKESRAHDKLLQAVLDYFLQDLSSDQLEDVVQTTLPPIYLQHLGHSLTIIGLEVRRDASLCLLVFDPGFTQSPGAERIGKRTTGSKSARILKAYRRDKGYLRRYSEYEILKLAPTPFPEQQQTSGPSS